ncbi:hypothetical protein ATANTOWER_031637 [Ataeniobius toweri]|uniref:Uncharacterized protein n=1 Tax=Ataeniobius toweri TaxID=208326 RepID=A0ABU7BLG2_9TELE|nr:hypothetical protein [Ataeniobius toweri]
MQTSRRHDDLIVKLAKDKFGAIQTEYQKPENIVLTLQNHQCLVVQPCDFHIAIPYSSNPIPQFVIPLSFESMSQKEKCFLDHKKNNNVYWIT